MNVYIAFIQKATNNIILIIQIIPQVIFAFGPCLFSVQPRFIIVIQGKDQKLLFDPQLRDDCCLSHALSISVTGSQVLDETEKMSSVERPIRSQQWGLN